MIPSTAGREAVLELEDLRLGLRLVGVREVDFVGDALARLVLGAILVMAE